MQTASVPEISEIRLKIEALEREVGGLKRDLERIEIQTALDRGKKEADRGLVIPAREWAKKIRAKHNLPR